MCFHTSNTKSTKQLQKRFSSKFKDKTTYEPTYHLNGFDYGNQYIITLKESGSIAPAMWGLLPTDFNNVNAFRKNFNTLNAKSETVLDSKLYKEAIRERRCLILADGFYESKHVNNKVYPHYIKYENNDAFAFAGIYNKHNEDKYSCTILTMEANPFIADIHNTKKRMPLILDKDYESNWLSNSLGDDSIKDLLKESFTKQKLEAYPVSKDVINSKIISNNPNIIKPYYYQELNTLF